MSTRTQHEAKIEVVREALLKHGVMRTGELVALGVSREYVRRLAQRGVLMRVARGLYALPEHEVTALHTMAVASRRAPRGVLCLLTALRFHGVTTQTPHEVWMAVDGSAWQPRPSDIPIRPVRATGAVLDAGIEVHVIEGVPVRVYSLAKTVADCFRYRRLVGLDVAVEALREVLHARRVSTDDLWHFASIDGVAGVMRPYLEAIP